MYQEKYICVRNNYMYQESIRKNICASGKKICIRKKYMYQEKYMYQKKYICNRKNIYVSEIYMYQEKICVSGRIYMYQEKYMYFAKGFDLIDHSMLMQELANLEFHPALLAWIAAFLTNRKQAVRIRGTLSGWLTLKGEVPQGTNLGVILFTVMINKLLSDWRLLIKYVDDTNALEIIPRNSTSLLNILPWLIIWDSVQLSH